MAVTGILGKKIGMTQVFDEKGDVHPITVLQAGPCVVTQLKTLANDGYEAAQIGLVEFVKSSKVNKPMAGHFGKSNVPPVKLTREVGVEAAAAPAQAEAADGDAPATNGNRLKAGDRILVDIFRITSMSTSSAPARGADLRVSCGVIVSVAAPRRTATCSRCRVRLVHRRFRRASFPGSACRGITAWTR